MRLSANRHSPFSIEALADRGIDPWAVRVSIDGLPCDLVVEADSTEGWADTIALDDHGQPVHDGDRVRIIRVCGRIEFSVGDAVLT